MWDRVRLPLAPKGPQQSSPGQRPGKEEFPPPQALKGRHKTAPGAGVSPFQGSEVRGCRVPGALPRAGLLRPLRGEIVPSQSASHEVRSRALTFPVAWTDLGLDDMHEAGGRDLPAAPIPDRHGDGEYPCLDIAV